MPTQIIVDMAESGETLREFAAFLSSVADRKDGVFLVAEAPTPVLPLTAGFVASVTDATTIHNASDVASVTNGVTNYESVLATQATDPVVLDSNGLPWDERIHSENRATNKDGSWRSRRNLSDDIRDKVTAELRQTYPAPVVVAAPPPPPADAVVEMALVPPPPSISTIETAPPPPPPPVVPAAPPAPTSSVTFGDLISRVAAAIANGKTTMANVVASLNGLGLTGLPDVAGRPDLIDPVLVLLGV